MADTTGVPFARRSRLWPILAAAVLTMTGGLGLTVNPSPTHAADSATADQSGAPGRTDSEKIDYSRIFTHVTDTVIDPEDNSHYPDIHDLYYWGSRHRVTMDVALPEEARGGDRYTLKFDSPVWAWMNIPEGLTVVNKAGATLATVTRTDQQTLTLALTDSVNDLKDITGHLTVQASHKGSGAKFLGKEAGSVVDIPFTILGGDGSDLGPDSTVHVRVSYPLGTDFTQSQQIYDQKTVGFSLNSRVLAKTPSSADFSAMDLRSFTATHTVATSTAVPACSLTDFNHAAASANWITGDYPEAATGDALSPSDLIISCDGAAQTVSVSLADGVRVPDGATGLTVNSYWVADAPGKSYNVHGGLTVDGVSTDSSPWVKDRTVTSPSIKGEADGTVRTVDVSLTKTSDEAGKSLKTGDEVIYTLTARNTDTTHTATDVGITDAVPEGLEIVSASDGGVYNSAARSVTWPKTDIAAQKNRAVTVTAKVTRTSTGTITNTGTIAGDNINCTPASDCTSTRDVTIANPAFTAQKLAQVTDTNDDGVAGDSGDQIHYSFQVANVGDTTLDSATLTDELLGITEVEMLDEPLERGTTTTFSDLEPYTITDEDVRATQVTNVGTVTVEGLDPIAPSVTTPALAAPEPAPSPSQPVQPKASPAPDAPNASPSAPDTAPSTTPPAPDSRGEGHSLAHTGADAATFGGVAALLVMIGGGIMALRRHLLVDDTDA